MERLVLSLKEIHHADIFDLVLQGIAETKAPGAGIRAETFLNQSLYHSIQAKEATTLAFPSMMSLTFCVRAYLEEAPCVLENVVNADALVRRLVVSTRRNSTNDSSIPLWHPHSDDNDINGGKVFERLLEAYSSLFALAQQSQKVEIEDHVEGLVRFFLKCHREGLIPDEQPSAKHLQYILPILATNTHPTTATTTTTASSSGQRNHATYREFVRVVEKVATAKDRKML